jgi:hypothetical protein
MSIQAVMKAMMIDHEEHGGSDDWKHRTYFLEVDSHCIAQDTEN